MGQAEAGGNAVRPEPVSTRGRGTAVMTWSVVSTTLLYLSLAALDTA